MASFNIHLAVAKMYLEKNNIYNQSDFYKGVIHPDLEAYEEMFHYTDVNRDKTNLIKYLDGKVILFRFLEERDIVEPYNRGVFLHLVTDYLFYTEFFEKTYLEKTSYNDFVKKLYKMYYTSNGYLLKRYEIDLDNFKGINQSKYKTRKIIRKKEYQYLERLDTFIHRVSNIDLNKYRDKILKEKTNTLPE